MDNYTRYDWRRVCIGIVLGTIILSGCILAFGGKADAAAPKKCGAGIYRVLDHTKAGYLTMDSRGARFCRQHGWIVTRRLVVDPFGQAVTTLPRCKNEDTSTYSCTWNALGRGNGVGHGFIALPGRTVYVDAINGHWVTSKRMREGHWTILPYNV